MPRAARRVRVVRSEHEEVVDRLVLALNTGDLQGLMDLLAPDVVSVADSGGKVRGAARRPVVGADRLARYLVGGMAKAGGAVTAVRTRVNGQAAVRMELNGQLVGIASVTVEQGRVTKVYSIANPDKLRRLDLENAARPLTRPGLDVPALAQCRRTASWSLVFEVVTGRHRRVASHQPGARTSGTPWFIRIFQPHEVDESVMEPAEQHAIVGVGGSAVDVLQNVVDLTPSGRDTAAGDDAAAVAERDRAALVPVEDALFGAESQDASVVAGR